MQFFRVSKKYYFSYSVYGLNSEITQEQGWTIYTYNQLFSDRLKLQQTLPPNSYLYLCSEVTMSAHQSCDLHFGCSETALHLWLFAIPQSHNSFLFFWLVSWCYLKNMELTIWERVGDFSWWNLLSELAVMISDSFCMLQILLICISKSWTTSQVFGSSYVP